MVTRCSQHTHNVDLPDLPAGTQAAHVIPGLASHLLLFVITMCNAGCTVTYTKINCTISYHSQTIICGSKCTRTGLRMVPLTKVKVQATSPSATTNHAPLCTSSTAAVAANIDTTSSTTRNARYIHQIMCSPPASTLLWALDLSKELATIPGLTTTLIKTICHAPPLQTRVTCNDTKPIQPPRASCSPTLLPHMLRLIACFPLKKSVLCTICSALPRLLMP
jgi:hypothetical protein